MKIKLIMFSYLMLLNILLLFLFNDYKEKNQPFRCTGTFTLTKNYDDKTYTINSSLSVIYTKKNEGTIRLKGSIVNSDKKHSILDRALSFKHIPLSQDMFKIEVTHEQKLIHDTTEDTVFKLFPLYDNNVRIQNQLYGNAIIFHDALTPQFICVTY
ncbi:hypothetical protein U3C50_001541 [Providencia rettgeri]|nr:hypothetical protein [Providencia rettgeri]